MSLQHRNAGSTPGESAREMFHRVNGMDGVGRAHNLAMDQYMRRVSEGKARGNLCDDILSFVVQASFLPADQRAGAEKVRMALSQVQNTGRCGQDGESTNSSPLHQSALRSTSTTQIPELSADANLLVSQMDYAVTTSATSTDLAGALLPVVYAANSLAPAEADIVDAAASVAQSSREYWEVTLTSDFILSQQQSINGSYGTCFDSHSDAETAVHACMGLYHSPLILPTTGDGPYLSHPNRVLLTQTTCNYINMTETVHQDFIGGVMGGIGGAFVGGIGAFAGAVAGAAYTSSAEMMWQMGLSSYCAWKRGRSPKPKVT